ncbi:helix-turn-helix domain-containing protein [Mucilaginibacter sp.]|uniref:helix-turn-helix domain-containing protein n=1 Tax=Mucilaginibacter sp. TaxID=1882438 RepID=UPI00374CB61F
MAKGISHKRNEKAIATLASNIKKYRLESNLTIQELANIIDVDYSQIGRMERGVVNPSISIVFDIADALQIKPSSLLE